MFTFHSWFLSECRDPEEEPIGSRQRELGRKALLSQVGSAEAGQASETAEWELPV